MINNYCKNLLKSTLKQIATKPQINRNIFIAPKPRILVKYCPQFFFSSDKGNNKITDILNKIQVQINNQKKGLLSSGIVTDHRFDQKTNKVIISINANKDFAKIRNSLKRLLSTHGYNDVEVSLNQKQQKKMFQRRENLSKIKKIIAVSSCKGGVGKSTIAVNIAYGLQQQGYKVGIFDSDVYGPSLPTLVNLEGSFLQSSTESTGLLTPKQAQGVKCMSFGFVANQPATMRGPMASSIVSQLLLQTQWGQLDYLIVDMPPGTGDVNLSLCEQIKFDGAVIVTTPQRLSFIDVLKGIKMFQDLRVRVLAIVQNMSYYSCSKCQTTDEIFGKGHNKVIMDQLGIDNAFKIPLIAEISKYSDLGTPAVLALPADHFVKQMYNLICSSIKSQLQKPKPKRGAFYDTGLRAIIVEQEKKQKKIDPVALRSKCKCPECVSQLTGQQLIKIEALDPEVYPVKIEDKGNYAVGVVWSDGHKNSIYSFRRLFSDEIAEKEIKQNI